MKGLKWIGLTQKKRTKAALALMYHRVSTCRTDPWQLSVSPRHFEEQLQVLSKSGRVKPISHFQDLLRNNANISPFILLTFDDGYIDNFLTVKPLLEKYELPAIFFIPTKFMESQREFWWDSLAFILLQKKVLPPFLNIKIGTSLKQYDLKGETNLSASLMKLHENWNAELSPPSKRAKAYLAIWKMLSPLSFVQQEMIMEQIRTWAEPEAISGDEYKVMTAEQVKQMVAVDLFSIGAHTHSHPVLPAHAKEIQADEISRNKETLENLTGSSVDTLAYPSGLYDDITIEAAKSLGFQLAFTTISRPLDPIHDPYQLGRYHINNWGGARFSKEINQFGTTR